MSKSLVDIVNTNTFEVWKTRTNEIITTLKSVVTIGDSETNSGNVVIDGDIRGTGTLYINTIQANTLNTINLNADLRVTGLLQVRSAASADSEIRLYKDSELTWTVGSNSTHSEFVIKKGTAFLKIGDLSGAAGLISGSTGLKLDAALMPATISSNIVGNLTGNTNGVVTATAGSTAVTAAAGDDDTSIATTAFVQAALRAIYPVGSIYTNAGVTTNPATLLGFGTWVAFGAGRVMVGFNSSDTSFDALEETGGSKDAVVVSHSHTFSGSATAVGNHQHAVDYPLDCGADRLQFGSTTGRTDVFCDSNGGADVMPLSSAAGAHSHDISGTIATTGTSGTNANLQPYITVAMWKRTA